MYNEYPEHPANQHPFIRNRNLAIYGTETPEPEKPKTRFEILKAKGWKHLSKVEKEEYQSLMPKSDNAIDTQSTSSPEVEVVSPDEPTSDILPAETSFTVKVD